MWCIMLKRILWFSEMKIFHWVWNAVKKIKSYSDNVKSIWNWLMFSFQNFLFQIIISTQQCLVQIQNFHVTKVSLYHNGHFCMMLHISSLKFVLFIIRLLQQSNESVCCDHNINIHVSMKCTCINCYIIVCWCASVE